MAHAYETIAHGGRRVSGTLANDGAPVAIQEVDAGAHTLPDGNHQDVNRVTTKPVLPASVAATETSMLQTVLQYGTGRAAATGQFAAGKTGTTSNYGDAWFVGWDSRYTVAVWVGYPNGLVPMTTAFNGGPVLGGTFPALIWHNFIASAMGIDKARAEQAAAGKPGKGGSEESGERSGTSTTEGAPSAPSGGGSGSSGGSGGANNGGGKSSAPSTGGEAGGGSSKAAPEAAPEASTPPAASQSPPPATPPASSPSPTGGVSPGG
jgi:penicillin-binding protein 1A